MFYGKEQKWPKPLLEKTWSGGVFYGTEHLTWGFVGEGYILLSVSLTISTYVLDACTSR
jgi:hypothetical protein